MELTVPEPASEGRRRATPGFLGYALAIAVSLVIFAFGLAAVDAWEAGNLRDFPDIVFVVVLFGAIPAAVVGAVGALVVHLLTWRATSQSWGVGGATVAGLVAGYLLYGDEVGPVLVLSLSAGLGRLAVVPLATARGASLRSPH
ncbi:conserved membrane hypothetical protein [Nocardioides sp. AX2bis]|nr:conserved membrane hypothetical protein [Nocardioides sp. AX2bis]